MRNCVAITANFYSGASLATRLRALDQRRNRLVDVYLDSRGIDQRTYERETRRFDDHAQQQTMAPPAGFEPATHPLHFVPLVETVA